MDNDKTIFTQFKETLLQKGLEYFGKYYGVYRGVVMNVDDPLRMGRLKIQCSAVYGNQTADYWAMGRGMIAGKGHGIYWIPSVGDPILVSFENGEPRFPMWEYGWWLKDQAPENAESGNHMFRTPSGHMFEMDDNTKEIKLTHAKGHAVTLKDDETIDILGNTDNAVRYSELESAFNELKGDYNDLVTKWNLFAAAYIPGSPTVTGSPPTASTGSTSSASVLAAKVDEIKMP